MSLLSFVVFYPVRIFVIPINTIVTIHTTIQLRGSFVRKYILNNKSVSSFILPIHLFFPSYHLSKSCSFNSGCSVQLVSHSVSNPSKSFRLPVRLNRDTVLLTVDLDIRATLTLERSLNNYFTE